MEQWNEVMVREKRGRGRSRKIGAMEERKDRGPGCYHNITPCLPSKSPTRQISQGERHQGRQDQCRGQPVGEGLRPRSPHDQRQMLFQA